MTHVNTHLSHRQRQANATRDRIVEAARELFATKGYASTTIREIAERSGVAVPTIYDAFTSKRGILEGARVRMLAEAEIPQLMARAREEADPKTKLNLAAKWLRQQMERSSDVIRAFREGARFDAEVAADHRRILDMRAASMADFVDTLAHALAPGVTTTTATDVLWAFSNEELYRELVLERGWDADRFESWLAATLHDQLLGIHGGHAQIGAQQG